MASARIQRWGLFLSGYQYTLRHSSGSSNGNADALSRLPLAEVGEEEAAPEEVILTMTTLATTPVKAVHIAQWTNRNPVLSRVREFVRHGWPIEVKDTAFQPYTTRRSELSVIDGCLVCGSMVVIPLKGQEIILEKLHEAHPGTSRMRSIGRSYVWWPGMDAAIETGADVPHHSASKIGSLHRKHLSIHGSGPIDHGRGSTLTLQALLWEGCSFWQWMHTRNGLKHLL